MSVKPPFAFLLFIFLCSHRTSAQETCFQMDEFRTKSVTITKPVNTHSDGFPLYAAVNGTVRPINSSISQIFRFLPASYWINTTSESCNSAVLNFTPCNSAIRLTEDFLNLSMEQHKVLPDRSLWGDRSVLLLTINRFSFKPYAGVCPSITICPVPGIPSEQFLRTLENPRQICKIPVNAATCDEMIDSAFHVLYPLATGAWIAVHNLGSNLTLYKDALQFVLTAAYRLDLDEFRCPPGLFACTPPGKQMNVEPEPKPEQEWPVRLCLPAGLRCDGVPNCPNGGSDEQNCNSSVIPVQFERVEGEQDRLQDWLSGYDAEVLSLIGRDLRVVYTAGGPNYLVLLIVICVVALVILLFVLLTLFVFNPLCRYKRQRSRQTIAKAASYEIISSESPVPC
ncbi:hypothetical protein CSKR_114107 [Clonorchis sinensis]|uniref:Uncharacterized protein n=1 Tax=Clonorchis sinensis TaxID=79923 RepID=A0A8T1N031_CLOSI|nr:hypothetical protein CSKR_114107 [Clonorchis sinensis]